MTLGMLFLKRIKQYLNRLLTFYRGFILFSLLMDSILVYQIHQYGPGVFSIVFWTKLLSLLFTFMIVHPQSRKKYYYYHNLGFSVRQLWIPLLVVDFIILIVACNIAWNLR